MKNSTIGDKIAYMILAVLLFIVVTLVPTFLWYCFDDALAALTGIPALGVVMWYHVWSFTLFVYALFGRTSIPSKKD